MSRSDAGRGARAGLMLLLAVLGLAGCRQTQVSNLGLQATPMPGASALASADVANLAGSPFGQDVLRQLASQPGLNWQQTQQQIEAATGLTWQDVTRAVVAVDGDRLAQMTGPEADAALRRDPPWVAGLTLDKPLSVARLWAALKASSLSGQAMAATQADYKGLHALTLTGQLAAGAENMTLFLGLSPDGKLVFAGGETAVKGALDRLISGQQAALDPRVAGVLQPTAQAPLVAQAAATPALREYLQRFAATLDQQPGEEARLKADLARQVEQVNALRSAAEKDPRIQQSLTAAVARSQELRAQLAWLQQQKALSAAVANLQSLALSGRATDNLAATVNLTTSSPQDATALATFATTIAPLLLTTPARPGVPAGDQAQVTTQGDIVQAAVTVTPATVESWLTQPHAVAVTAPAAPPPAPEPSPATPAPATIGPNTY